MHNDGILMDTCFMETRGQRINYDAAAAMMTLCILQAATKVYHYETLNSFLAKITLYF